MIPLFTAFSLFHVTWHFPWTQPRQYAAPAMAAAAAAAVTIVLGLPPVSAGVATHGMGCGTKVDD